MNNSPEALIEQLTIPNFVNLRADGVFVQPALLQTNGDFELFVHRLFSSEGRFACLDYAALLFLLYDYDGLQQARNKGLEIKLAMQIVRFLPQRQTLYRAVKVLEGGKRAEYVFEPVSIQVSYEVPVYGEPDDDGMAQIVGYESKTREQPAKLDFDEFVADMWRKGVKFGIDETAVRESIASGQATRMTFAQHREPTEGRDASILEACPDLHRDNSPKVLANGQVDLRVFKNRFPQMTKGTRLLKKIPRELGKQGRKVTGEAIEPKLPKDIDLSVLSAQGTKVEQLQDGEYIVATLDGFLTLDTKSNQVSITEKIENKVGVSVKTTGDLALGVDEFIEHGEVQEGRVVKGIHMTFLSDVFGKLSSINGNIRIDGCLSGGEAETLGGSVTLNGHVSRSLVRASDGEVIAKHCESSTLIGKVVRVEHAINCEIVAEEVYADLIEGCVIAANKIEIGVADERRGNETLVTVMIPDLASFDLYIAKMKKTIADTQAAINTKLSQIEQVKSNQEFAKYLALAEQVKSGALKLTAEQLPGWRKLLAKHENLAALLVRLEAEIEALAITDRQCEEELSYTERECDALIQRAVCNINKVTGQTSGQTMKAEPGVKALSAMNGSDIRAFLQKSDSRKERVFSGDSGRINWKLKGNNA